MAIGRRAAMKQHEADHVLDFHCAAILGGRRTVGGLFGQGVHIHAAMAFLICSSTSLALAGIGVPGP